MRLRGASAAIQRDYALGDRVLTSGTAAKPTYTGCPGVERQDGASTHAAAKRRDGREYFP